MNKLAILQRHLTAADIYQVPPADAKYASKCYFPSSSYLKVPVLSIQQHTSNTKIIKFGLPPSTSLTLPVSSCIMLESPFDDAAKPYNPISSNSVTGSFSLLIKQNENGTVSKFAGDLRVGDSVGFCQFKGNIKSFQYPFPNVNKITMVCTGTGITPHFQALLPLLESNDTTEIKLIFGNKTYKDILLYNELNKMEAMSQGRLKITYVVGSHENDTTYSNGGEIETGWINFEKIQRLAFPASTLNSRIWVCGVPGLYNALAGSRKDPMTADSILARLGYKEEQVWRS